MGGEIPERFTNFYFHKFASIYPYFITGWIWCFSILHICKKADLIQIIKDLSCSIYEILLIPQLIISINDGGAGNKYDGVAWYISAMLLAMIIIVPLILYNNQLFFRIIGPGIVVFGLGLSFTMWGTIQGNDWRGFLEALVLLSMGYILYCFTMDIKNRAVQLKSWIKMICTIIELIMWAISFVSIQYRYNENFREWDYILIILMSIGIFLTNSGLSYTYKLPSLIFSKYIGRLCMAWYLTHRGWNYIFMYGFLQELKPSFRLAIYMLLSFITSIMFCVVVEILLKRLRRVPCPNNIH